MIFPAWQVRYLHTTLNRVVAKFPFAGVATVTAESHTKGQQGTWQTFSGPTVSLQFRSSSLVLA